MLVLLTVSHQPALITPWGTALPSWTGYHHNLMCTFPPCHSNCKSQVPGAPPAVLPAPHLRETLSKHWLLCTLRLDSMTGLGRKKILCHSSNIQVYTDPACETRHCLLAKSATSTGSLFLGQPHADLPDSP